MSKLKNVKKPPQGGVSGVIVEPAGQFPATDRSTQPARDYGSVVDSDDHIGQPAAGHIDLDFVAEFAFQQRASER